jgi:hypothetical protein
MNKSKIIIYCPQFSDCPLIKIILKSDFITETVGTLEELLKKLRRLILMQLLSVFVKHGRKILPTYYLLNPFQI